MTASNQLIAKKKEQANRHFQARQLPQAHALYTELCQANNQDANAWFMLGIIKGQIGRINEAEECCRKALTLQPNNYSAWDNLGIALMLQGRAQEAKSCFENALRINPADEQACNAMGNLMREQGRQQEAVKYFRKALSIKPDYAEAHNNLANVYKDSCQTDIAIASYREALRINPNYTEACFNLGTALAAKGDLRAALASYRRTLKLQPGSVEAIAAIASIYEMQSEYTKAQEILEPCLKGKPVPACVALAFADLAPWTGKTTEAIKLLEQVLADQSPGLINRQELLFKLGRLLDKQNRFDKAFSVYQKANSIRPYPYEMETTRKQIQALKSVFNADTVRQMQQAENTSDLPVFIVGMPRSGSTLVEQIVACHPDVHGAGELPYLTEVISTARARHNGNDAFMAHPPPGELDELAQQYLAKLTPLAPGSRYISDKMPHNFLLLGHIDRLFPQAHVIHCVRNPLDTCLSIYFQNFNANHPYAADPELLGDYYTQYIDLMRHWKQVLNIPILDVQYEELVRNQKQTSRMIVDFLQLEWNDKCLAFHESTRVVTTPSYNQVKQPVHSGSIDRWKNYTGFLQPLKHALGIKDPESGLQTAADQLNDTGHTND
jgi:tetratricopeptide (TPR) repeat protein